MNDKKLEIQKDFFKQLKMPCNALNKNGIANTDTQLNRGKIIGIISLIILIILMKSGISSILLMQ
jgi:hypothetical protein